MACFYGANREGLFEPVMHGLSVLRVNGNGKSAAVIFIFLHGRGYTACDVFWKARVKKNTPPEGGVHPFLNNELS
jgi:hypothetical protein